MYQKDLELVSWMIGIDKETLARDGATKSTENEALVLGLANVQEESFIWLFMDDLILVHRSTQYVAVKQRTNQP